MNIEDKLISIEERLDKLDTTHVDILAALTLADLVVRAFRIWQSNSNSKTCIEFVETVFKYETFRKEMRQRELDKEDQDFM